MKEYKTVKISSQSEFTDRKSRFIANVAAAESVEQALAFVASIKAKYKDASHNCYAYLLTDGNMRLSDDGEPQGTAGKPILEVLQRQNLFNVVVVITRYFGGIKLGSGLAGAYATATTQGIAESGIATMTLACNCSVTTDYNNIGRILHLLEQQNIGITSSNYTDIIELNVLLPEQQVTLFTEEITQISSGKSTVSVVDTSYYPL